MNPIHHPALSEADLPDTLMQLLLPSDEWYYTNHSTKYARYVKYHAARILVYMGLFLRLGGRVDLFDSKRECFLWYLSPSKQGRLRFVLLVAYTILFSNLHL